MKKKKMTTKEMEKEMLKENQLIFKKLVKKNVEEGKLEAFNLGKREVFISTSEPRWLRDWIKEGAKMGLFKNESFPISENLARLGFYIPSGLGLSNYQIDEVIKTIKEFSTNEL